ncbi:hypothetical protein POM88_011259 [Heracleum sosnowskyi]|uniref:Helitron helicase-like domain-containing protein n=1 Tax=Heracleum sosnowskyi TaxID=360622 RepID=A0AAD8IWH5_9APIA|nr:hypothetical protein POM88_011259 [Heracleum sosnowskyi]
MKGTLHGLVIVEDIKKKAYFGECVGIMYVVEFQKRGLPHVHMLICKHFPKKYQSQTIFDQSGFPVYKRIKTGITVKKGKAELDNQYVVPYNHNLLVKYQCHMNVEICCHARSLKYLFKYCLKGHDHATVEVSSSNKETDSAENPLIDEIQAYFDGRYICGAESAYLIFGFDVQYRSIYVLRLSFHLPGEKNCTFRENEELHKVVEREKWRRSQLEAFFILTSKTEMPDEIPRYYVWNDSDNVWTVRKKRNQIGRLFYAHHTSGEIWKENVNANITIIDKQLEFYVLAEIDKLLKCIGKSLKHYEDEKENLRIFTEWILKIGDGKIHPPSDGDLEYEENDIVIPADFCDPDTTNSVDNMIEWTYPNFMDNYKCPKYLSERAILTLTNQTVGHLNGSTVHSRHLITIFHQ